MDLSNYEWIQMMQIEGMTEAILERICERCPDTVITALRQLDTGERLDLHQWTLEDIA